MHIYTWAWTHLHQHIHFKDDFHKYGKWGLNLCWESQGLLKSTKAEYPLQKQPILVLTHCHCSHPIWNKSGQRKEASNARAKEKLCCMTTRTIFNKCRNKVVPRNNKQEVGEQLKLTCYLQGIPLQCKQPRPLPSCANQGHSDWAIPELAK